MEHMGYESCTAANGIWSTSYENFFPPFCVFIILVILVILIIAVILWHYALLIVPRLVEREEAPRNHYPFMAYVYIIKSDGEIGHCGGILVSRKDVLTCAHALENASYIEVMLGVHNNLAVYEPTRQIYVCNKFKIHEGWNRTSAVNDLALIELPKMVTINDAVKIISLPTRFDTDWNPLPGQMATVCGWGYHPKKKNSALHYAHCEIIDNFHAQSIFKQHEYSLKIQDSHLPMLGVERNATAPGDSGGPVIVDNKLVGIISFLYDKGYETKIPEVATKVTHYADWIKQKIAGPIGIGDQWISKMLPIDETLREEMALLLILCLRLSDYPLFRPLEPMDCN